MIELSSDDKLDLLSKWMKHHKIDEITLSILYGTPQRLIKEYRETGKLFLESRPKISFEDYCKNAHFLNLVAL
jgi:hypothetical protein